MLREALQLSSCRREVDNVLEKAESTEGSGLVKYEWSIPHLATQHKEDKDSGQSKTLSAVSLLPASTNFTGSITQEAWGGQHRGQHGILDSSQNNGSGLRYDEYPLPTLTSKIYSIWSSQKSQDRKKEEVLVVGRIPAEDLDGTPELRNVGVKSKINIFYWVQRVC